MPAHLAEPDGAGPFPGAVVIMEAFGLLPHVRAVAERLAGEGYVALAPDFYYRHPGSQVGYDELPRAIELMQTIDDAKFTRDLSAAFDLLAARDDANGRLGVTGFCMGGRLSFVGACELPDRIAAAAPFYGGGIVRHLDRADRIRAPLLLFFGEADPYIPLDEVRRIEARLGELGADAEIHTYAGADHGFFCDERASYHPAAAADAWSRLKRFFAAHLRGG